MFGDCFLEMAKYYKEISHLLALGEEHFEEELRKLVSGSPTYFLSIVVFFFFFFTYRSIPTLLIQCIGFSGFEYGTLNSFSSGDSY